MHASTLGLLNRKQYILEVIVGFDSIRKVYGQETQECPNMPYTNHIFSLCGPQTKQYTK